MFKINYDITKAKRVSESQDCNSMRGGDNLIPLMKHPKTKAQSKTTE